MTRSAADFVSILGPALRSGDEITLAAVGERWGISLPSDYVDVVGSYGDVLISEYMYVCGARNLESYAAGLGRMMEASATVGRPVLPSRHGVLLWGHTVECDKRFLVPHSNGEWTVSAFRRNWHDWIDTGHCFSDWLYLALTGATGTDWLPEWDALPHPVEPAAGY